MCIERDYLHEIEFGVVILVRYRNTNTVQKKAKWHAKHFYSNTAIAQLMDKKDIFKIGTS